MGQADLMRIGVELGGQIFNLDLYTAPSYLQRVPHPITMETQKQLGVRWP